MIVVYPDIDATHGERGQISGGVIVESGGAGTLIKAWDDDSYVCVDLDYSEAEALARQILGMTGRRATS